MTRDQILSIVRFVLTIGGGLLIGRSISGVPVTQENLELLFGIASSGLGLVWGFLDKSLTEESFQSAIGHIVSVGGGILVTSGKLSANSLSVWLGFITAAAPLIWSAINKNKNAKIAKAVRANNHAFIAKLTGVKKK